MKWDDQQAKIQKKSNYGGELCWTPQPLRGPRLADEGVLLCNHFVRRIIRDGSPLKKMHVDHILMLQNNYTGHGITRIDSHHTIPPLLIIVFRCEFTSFEGYGWGHCDCVAAFHHQCITHPDSSHGNSAVPLLTIRRV